MPKKVIHCNFVRKTYWTIIVKTQGPNRDNFSPLVIFSSSLFSILHSYQSIYIYISAYLQLTCSVPQLISTYISTCPASCLNPWCHFSSTIYLHVYISIHISISRDHVELMFTLQCPPLGYKISTFLHIYTYLHIYISISQSPVEQLQDVSLASGWGEPVYTPVPEPESAVSPAQGAGDTSGPQAGAKFCYKVRIVMMMMVMITNDPPPGDPAQPPPPRPPQHLPAHALAQLGGRGQGGRCRHGEYLDIYSI